MTDNEDIHVDELETNIAEEQNEHEVNVVVQDDEQADDALRIAQQALDEIRQMRQEQDAEWKQTIEQKLSAIWERLNSTSNEASEPDETLEIETPPAPKATSRRRKTRRLKF